MTKSIIAILIILATITTNADSASLRLGRSHLLSSIPRSWNAYSSYDLQKLFGSKLGDMDLTRRKKFLALQRTLNHASLKPRMLVLADSEDQTVLFQKMVKNWAQSLLREASAINKNSLEPPSTIIRINDLLSYVGDIEQILEILPTKERALLAQDLRAARQGLLIQLQENAARLIQEAMSRWKAEQKISWHGRTAVLTLPNGYKLGLKFKKDERPLYAQREGENLQRARLYGIHSPVPLPNGAGGFAHFFTEQAPKDLKKRRFLAYLIPREIAGKFFVYITDRFSGNQAQRFRTLKSAALRAVKHMVLLNINGVRHASLLPMTHSDTNWKWHFWRHEYFDGRTLYGPSDIENWDSAVEHSNLRLSGLADFEHLRSARLLGGRRDVHLAENGKRLLIEYDYEGVGQNLTELSVAVLHSALRINQLSHDQVVKIISEGIIRHAGERLSPGTFRDFLRLRKEMKKFIQASVINFDAHALGGRIPGGVLQPFVMGVIKPYVEILNIDRLLRRFQQSPLSSSLVFPGVNPGLASARLPQ